MKPEWSNNERFAAGCLVLFAALILILIIGVIFGVGNDSVFSRKMQSLEYKPPANGVLSQQTKREVESIFGVPRSIDTSLSELAEGVKAAEDFEDTVLSTVPMSRACVDYLDIDGDDGHLMIWVRRQAYNIDRTAQWEIYTTILKRWRRTEWAQKHQHGRWAEILVSDPVSGETKTIRKIK